MNTQDRPDDQGSPLADDVVPSSMSFPGASGPTRPATNSRARMRTLADIPNASAALGLLPAESVVNQSPGGLWLAVMAKADASTPSGTPSGCGGADDTAMVRPSSEVAVPLPAGDAMLVKAADNRLAVGSLIETLGWEPGTPLVGVKVTNYAWQFTPGDHTNSLLGASIETGKQRRLVLTHATKTSLGMTHWAKALVIAGQDNTIHIIDPKGLTHR